jgi:hypothetical protein
MAIYSLLHGFLVVLCSGLHHLAPTVLSYLSFIPCNFSSVMKVFIANKRCIFKLIAHKSVYNRITPSMLTFMSAFFCCSVNNNLMFCIRWCQQCPSAHIYMQWIPTFPTDLNWLPVYMDMPTSGLHQKQSAGIIIYINSYH